MPDGARGHIFGWPSRIDWKLTAAVSIAFAGLATSFGLATGLYIYHPLNDLNELAYRSAIAFFAPGLLEELIFRGPLVWMVLRYRRAPLWAIGLSLLAFILWHPLNAAVNLVEARELFFDWRFLTVATGLGAVATYLAIRTRSLWPPVLFHWLAVVGWTAFLGAPNFF